MKNTLDEKLHTSYIVLENTINNPGVLQKLAMYKYDLERLKGGKALYENVMKLYTRQQKEYGEQYEATDALQLARDEAHGVYMKHLTVARVALEDQRGYGKALQLDGPRNRTLAGWLKQANIFYDNIHGVVAEMEKYGITAEELAQGQAMIQAVASASAKQQKEKEEAVASTQKRDEALQELNRWMSRFMRIARLALKEEFQELETEK